MSIRFKFRSSVNFDTIEIDDGKPYVSVGELRSKIVCQKKLNGICHKDFDLVFLDDLTGQEYNDDEFKIPSGSSVIIKRVPAEPVPITMLKHHKLEASEISEDIPKGVNHNRPEEIIPQKNPALVDNEHIELKKVANTKGIDLEKVDLPSELRCPICNTYFKNAVMIPCCQHSFCEKCICDVLPLKSRCPKCSSTKYRVQHLLPNLSLRHAIEHFLESQILATTPENNLQKYVPDGESGIQGKEVSNKKKLDLVYSEKKPNKNMAESSVIDLMNSTPLLKVTNQNHHEDLTPSVDSEGENQPIIPNEGYAVNNRNKMVQKTCYNCGSPTHFIRDCPIASNEHQVMWNSGDHMFQGGMSGYPLPYWNTPVYPQVNPYMNMYGNPFSQSIIPVTPYGVPPYMTPTYGNLPVHSGVMRMGGPAHVGPRGEQPSDDRMKYSNEKRQRSSDYERSTEYKSNRNRGKEVSNSEESHGRKLKKDHHYDKHQDVKMKSKRYEKHSHSTNKSDRSVSGVDDVHSGNHENYKRHHQSDSDCSCSHHLKKGRDVKRKNKESCGDRWQIVSGSDDDHHHHHHHNKRKKVY